MRIKRKQLAVDYSISDKGEDNVIAAIINPMDDSRVCHSSLDEEKFKEILWPRIVLA